MCESELGGTDRHESRGGGQGFGTVRVDKEVFSWTVFAFLSDSTGFFVPHLGDYRELQGKLFAFKLLQGKLVKALILRGVSRI